jgi:hypothetical protein
MTVKGEKPCGRERVPFARQFFSSFIWPRRCGASVGGNGVARAQEWGLPPIQTVGNVRTAMGLGDSQVRQEEGDWLGAHRGATIGRQGELNR